MVEITHTHTCDDGKRDQRAQAGGLENEVETPDHSAKQTAVAHKPIELAVCNPDAATLAQSFDPAMVGF